VSDRPTIRTTLGALVQADPTLAAIAALPLHPAAAYHVHKLRALVTGEVRHFHDVRNAAITELGTACEGGFQVLPDNPHLPELVQRATDLAAVPVEIPWGPITLAMLGDQAVSAQQLLALGPLLAEPVDEATP
jgi:hypothetical protein